MDWWLVISSTLPNPCPRRCGRYDAQGIRWRCWSLAAFAWAAGTAATAFRVLTLEVDPRGTDAVQAMIERLPPPRDACSSAAALDVPAASALLAAAKKGVSGAPTISLGQPSATI